jgi:small-conductance mechanosensitive channel
MNKMLASVFLIISVFLGVSAPAQDEKPAEPEQGKARGYPVKLGDQTIFYIVDVEGLSTPERADTITARIKALADDPHIPVTSITTAPYPQPITLITVNNDLIMSVLEEDAIAQGLSREEVATEYSVKLRRAIEKYREEHSMKWIIRGVFHTCIATMVLIAALYILNRFYLKVTASLKERLKKKEETSVLLQTFEIVRRDRFVTMIVRATKLISLMIALILFYFYIHSVLRFFPWTRGYADHVFSFLIRPFQVLGKGIWLNVPNIFFVAVIILISYYLLGALRLLFNELHKQTITITGFYPEWSQPTYRMVRIFVIASAVVIAFPYIPGSGSTAFKGLSIFAGIIISLGSTSFVSNIIAGYTLIYRRVFKIGDRVQIDNFIGDVINTRLQVTHLRSIKNEEIIVPNSLIVNSNVINYTSLSRPKGLIIHTTVTIGYDSPWRQVHALLIKAAQRTPGLKKKPGPFILQTSLDDYYVSYELNAYTNAPQNMQQIYSDLHTNIQDAFNEYGVQIMSPSYEFDPQEPKIVPREQWYAPPAKPPGGVDDRD